VCTVTLGQSPDGTSHNVGRYSKPLLKRITAIYNEQMAAMELARGAMEAPLDAAKACPDVRLRAVFSSIEAKQWQSRRLGEICHLLPSKSIATDGKV
jgi:hypothetical protein